MAIIALPKYSGNLFRWWEPRWATGTADSHTQAELEADAANCEIWIGHYNQLHASTAATRSSRVTQMHAAAVVAGHECVVAVYVNGTFASSGKNPNSGVYPTATYMPSTNLAFPYLSDNGNTWLMDPKHPAWNNTNPLSSSRSLPDEADWRRATAFTDPNADGIIVDNCGWGVVSATYNEQSTGANPPTKSGTTESPLNTLTGGVYGTSIDRAYWNDLTNTLLAHTYTKVGHEGSLATAFYANGGSQGTRFFDSNGPTKTLSNHAMLVMFESWVRAAGDALDPVTGQGTQADWIKDLNSVLYLQRIGRGALLYTKIWPASPHAGHVTGAVSSNGTIYYQSADDDSDLASVTQWHKVLAGSYMLVNDGQSFFHFRHDSAGGNERIPQDRWYNNINALGWFTNTATGTIATSGTGGVDAATGGLKQADGTYRRLFTNGVVIVNSDTVSQTVTLPAVPAGKTSWRDVDGTNYTSSQAGIVMTRNTALILRGV